MFEAAPCKQHDTDKWFPEDGGNAAEAKKICSGCAYVRECRVAGLAEQHGIWGGQGTRWREHRRDIVRRICGGLGPHQSNKPLWTLYNPTSQRILERVDAGVPLEAAMREAGFSDLEIDRLFSDLAEGENDAAA